MFEQLSHKLQLYTSLRGDLASNWGSADSEENMSHTERVIRTPGKSPIFVQPRPNGGWRVSQGARAVLLAADETKLLIEILGEQ